MNDPNRFAPHTPEEKVTVIITKREAVALQQLRKYPYGKVVVHKADGLIIRLEPTNSILIEPDKEQVDLG